MSHWYCPACQAGLYWQSHKVRFGCPSGRGKCPTCKAALIVRTPRSLWILAFVGWLGGVVAAAAHQMPSALAGLPLFQLLPPQTMALAALALQLPLLVLGPHFEALPPQP